jgi:hypothetical protein
VINNRQSVDSEDRVPARTEPMGFSVARNHKLRRGSPVASSAADLQQNLASRLKRSINQVPGASRSEICTFKVATGATFTIGHRPEYPMRIRQF